MNCLKDSVNKKYFEVMGVFSDEIERIRKVSFSKKCFKHSLSLHIQLYQSEKASPPLANNMPPLSGKMYWARQLSFHLERPMHEFQKKPSLLKSGPGSALVRNYNQIALALTEYEIVHYKAWLKLVEHTQHSLHVSFSQVSCAKSSLLLISKVPVLIRCDGVMEPNLHSSVVFMMEEAKWMTHLGMKVPPEVHSTTLICLKKNYDQLKVYIYHCVSVAVCFGSAVFTGGGG